MSLKICKNCVMDTSDPSIQFDENGQCSHCNSFYGKTLPAWQNLLANKEALFKLKEDVEISFDNDPDNEFDCFKWVSYWYPLNVIISFKEKVYREALNKLKYSFCKEFNNV